MICSTSGYGVMFFNFSIGRKNYAHLQMLFLYRALKYGFVCGAVSKSKKKISKNIIGKKSKK